MRFRILSSGYLDLAEGRDFYESQSQGLGSYFLESIFTEVESLSLYAGIHRQVFGYHRILVPRFPYSIYYKIESNEAIVYRVLDCRRDPKKIRRKLK